MASTSMASVQNWRSNRRVKPVEEEKLPDITLGELVAMREKALAKCQNADVAVRLQKSLAHYRRLVALYGDNETEKKAHRLEMRA